jgi:hypothetical protein
VLATHPENEFAQIMDVMIMVGSGQDIDKSKMEKVFDHIADNLRPTKERVALLGALANYGIKPIKYATLLRILRDEDVTQPGAIISVQQGTISTQGDEEELSPGQRLIERASRYLQNSFYTAIEEQYVVPVNTQTTVAASIPPSGRFRPPSSDRKR